MDTYCLNVYDDLLKGPSFSDIDRLQKKPAPTIRDTSTLEDRTRQGRQVITLGPGTFPLRATVPISDLAPLKLVQILCGVWAEGRVVCHVSVTPSTRFAPRCVKLRSP